MSRPFADEPDPFDVTVTATVVGETGGSTIISATLENGTDAGGGEAELRITEGARRAYGLPACVAEFERFVNSVLRPEFRLDAALATAGRGAFTVVTTPTAGPLVVTPTMRFADDLAA